MGRDRPLALVRVASFVCAALVLVALTGCGRLDKDAVSTELKTLRSATAEGMLVAGQAARSRAPADFIEIRTAELSKQAKNSADALAETPTESGLQEAATKGNEIGNRASDLLDALHSDPGNSNLATKVTHELGDLSDEAESTEASL
jgi:hypothetical protein